MDRRRFLKVASGGLRLPSSYIARWNADGVDNIGLSVSDKANVRAEIWALLFDINDDPYTDEQRIINIETSTSLLNIYELIGKAGSGYVLYSTGTAQSILNKALRYFRLFIFLNYTDHENYINQENYA